MNKIDLIIECMEQILNDELPSPENMMKAFRYAQELKALKPVGEIRNVVWGGMAWSVSFISHEKLNLKTKLYALDEVTK